MKKMTILLLCLMLALPLQAFADGTEPQPSAQAETQPPQPSESQPAPTESQPAPTESQPAPTESQPAPTESQPAPTETQPAPTETQPPQPTETVPSDHTHVWDVSATVPATCTEEGATAYGCSACGAITYEILPAAGHKFSTQWTRKAAGHWHACSVCGEQGDFGKHYPGPAATEERPRSV